MATTSDKQLSVFKSIDWLTILLYIALLAFGWMSICGACYEYGQPRDLLSLADFSTRTGMQLVWIASSMVLATVIMFTDDRLFDSFAYIIYGLLMLLLLATPFLAHDIKGSMSWIKIGSFSLQPAEFAKFATALALAKFMGSYGFKLQGSWKNMAVSILLILTPMVLIIMQKETGSALVYTSLVLMLYREGLPGFVLFMGISAVAIVVVGLRFAEEPLVGEFLSLGDVLVGALILLFVLALLYAYCRPAAIRDALSADRGAGTYHSILSRRRFFIGLFAVGAIILHLSAGALVDHLAEHQRNRVQVLLGLRDDPNGVGYNVIQAKIAIGSGGLEGKGFLNGTQTKLKYVPEQETDFIFCTVGEEQGFIGSAAVLLLFLALLLRLLYVAERQPYAFGRVYGYCVFSVFFFHVLINVGMVLGLMPVIGIPLPFFSYGGSSLWGFTLLLFIFLRIDAGRSRLKR
ncbi:MAG: rod shape-determining protein RodA [Bacteroidaceae bacterium]|nr:rod shape-determining protein RodA [Bacteroidaceae bacterium]MBR1801064.1 rod shape-determining protein RodA [Bacteroidaceae bacterium]